MSIEETQIPFTTPHSTRNPQSKEFVNDSDEHFHPQGQHILIDIEEAAVIGMDVPFASFRFPNLKKAPGTFWR